ncbi:MAG: Queuine tRNA-ribosyltransferase, partial [uncultured Rubrobacteraceae bacterium]
AGGHQGHGQGPHARGPARRRRGRRTRQYLPPLPAPWGRHRAGGGGAPWFQRLGRADAHRFRRVPGLLAREDAPDRRRWRQVRLRLRRFRPRVHAGAHDEGAGGPRRGRRHGPRRVPARQRRPRVPCRVVTPDGPLGGAVQEGARQGGSGPVRDRAGRAPQGPSRREPGADRRDRLPRLRRRGPLR